MPDDVKLRELTESLRKEIEGLVTLYSHNLQADTALPTNFVQCLEHIRSAFWWPQSPDQMLNELALLKGLTNYMPLLKEDRGAKVEVLIKETLDYKMEKLREYAGLPQSGYVSSGVVESPGSEED